MSRKVIMIGGKTAKSFAHSQEFGFDYFDIDNLDGGQGSVNLMKIHMLFDALQVSAMVLFLEDIFHDSTSALDRARNIEISKVLTEYCHSRNIKMISFSSFQVFS